MLARVMTVGPRQLPKRDNPRTCVRSLTIHRFNAAMDLGLADKVALVTGAGSGIGAVIATRLAEHGCRVYVADSNLSAATETADQCNGRGHAIDFDVGNASRACEVVEQIVRERDRLDIVVNNAGILKIGSVVDASIEDWDEVCRVNLSGVYYCCKAALPTMMAQRYGKIVNIASVSAVKGRRRFWKRSVRYDKGRCRGTDQGPGARVGAVWHQRECDRTWRDRNWNDEVTADTGTPRSGAVRDSAGQVRIHRRHCRHCCPARVRRSWLCHG